MRSFAISVAFAVVIISSPALGAKSRTLTSAAPSQTALKTSLQVSTTSSPQSTQARATKRKVTPAISTVAAVPAAAPTTPDGTYLGGCDAGLLSASACQGYYSGNVFDGSPTDIPIQQSAIAALPGDFVWNGDWGSLDGTAAVTTSLVNGNMLDFGAALLGETIIGVHFGNVAGDAFGNVSAFYSFNFTDPTRYITLNDTQGFSNAVLYTTTHPDSVPEPATWAMMLLGFGAAAVAMRRSRRKTQLVSQLA
jgi:hypothetical protein